MGAWGTSLYANDSADDIRFEYLDKLRRGVSNEEIVESMIRDQGECIDDPEDAPLFWFALADTQWNYGRLMPEVKEKALYYLTQNGDLEVWREAGAKKLNAWLETRKKLEEKLHTPQPPVKKVSPYRLFRCKWQLGDVFAYKLQEEVSKEYGYFEKYIAFRKIDEIGVWPGHIVPVIEVYYKIWDDIPTIEELREVKLLPISLYPTVLLFHPDEPPLYRIHIDIESERNIPKDRLFFLGNMSSEVRAFSPEVSQHNDMNCVRFKNDGWNIELTTLKLYHLWEEYHEDYQAFAKKYLQIINSGQRV